MSRLYDPQTGNLVPLSIITDQLGNNCGAPGSIAYGGGSIGQGALLVTGDSYKANYKIALPVAAPYATPTDLFTLKGSATKTVRVKRVYINAYATTAGNMDCLLIKRTAVNTGGTLVAQSIAQKDSNDPVATAVGSLYSVAPVSLGTGVNIGSQVLEFPLAGVSGVAGWDFCVRFEKAIVLRGVNQLLAINFLGEAVPAGGVIGLDIDWEEDAS